MPLAHGEQEAAERLQKQDFDLVLIDMKLPGGDGRQVFLQVRQARPEARTVLITGYRAATEQLVHDVLAEGADAACYKPFDMPALLAAPERLSQAKRGKP